MTDPTQDSAASPGEDGSAQAAEGGSAQDSAQAAEGGGAQEEPNDTPLEEKQGRLDRFRGTGVGVEDPNIAGDAGPDDVAPGADP